MFERIKYLAFFILALASAFFTYQAFIMFQGNAYIGLAPVVVNTAILMVIWFLSFTSKSDLVRDNLVLFIFIPIAAIHTSNIALHFQTAGTSLKGLLFYITASSSLVFFSYMSSIQEEKI